MSNLADSSFLRLPPHSVEHEQSVLGGLLLVPDAWDRVADILTADDFYRDDHRRIFGHIAKLHTAGKPVDALTVHESVKQANEEEQIGGLAYLGALANETPGAANIRRYAEIVADKSLRRRLLIAGDQIGNLAYSGEHDDARSAVDEAQGILMRMDDFGRSSAEPMDMSEVLAQSIDQIQTAYDRGDSYSGLPTGFHDLDEAIGGMQPGDYVVVAGRPAMGKTTLGLNIAENAALDGKNTAVFSLEMGAAQLGKRSLSRFAKVPLDRLLRASRLQDDDWDRLTNALGKLHGIPLRVDESAGLTVSQIAARCRRLMRKHGPLSLVVIDYLQLLRAPNSKIVNSKNDAVGEISAEIKSMAKSLACPVIVLSQLSRKVEERGDRRPVMSDLRDSGSIEQDADIIVMMYRDEYYNSGSINRGMAEAIVVKHRNGATGMTPLVFNGELCHFADAVRGSYHIQSPAKKKAGGRGFSDDD